MAILAIVQAAINNYHTIILLNKAVMDSRTWLWVGVRPLSTAGRCTTKRTASVGTLSAKHTGVHRDSFDALVVGFQENGEDRS
jgi:hypothetical protein